MADVRVYINNQEADIEASERTQIASTFSISDIRDINVSNSTTTKTITLPATETNKIIFGFAEDVNSLTSFSNATKIEGRVEVDGSVVVQGAVKLSRPIIDGGKRIVSYKINILSGIADWKFLIGGLNVRDLDFSEYDHAYTLANQNLSETINGALGGLDDDFLVYPLINYGLMDGAGKEVTVIDRKPAFNVGRILDKIFNDQGFKISSAFRDSTFFSRLYIPFTNDKLAGVAGSEDDLKFNVTMTGDSFHGTLFFDPTAPDAATLVDADAQTPLGEYLWFTDHIAFDDETTTGFFDTGSNFTPSAVAPPTVFVNASPYTPIAGGFYTVPQNSKQKLTANIQGKLQMVYHTNWIDGTGNDPDVRSVEKIRLNLSITVNGGKEVSQSVTFQVPTVPGLPPNGTPFTQTFNTTLETQELTLIAGDIVKVKMEYYVSNNQVERTTTDKLPLRLDGVETSVTIDTLSTFFNEPMLDVQAGNTMNIANNMIDIDQVEFIRALKHLFNLYFYTDVEERTVYIEPRDDFYDNEALNWIDKLDHSNPIAIEYLGDQYSRQIRYRYKDDSNDFGVDLIEEESGEDAVLASHTTDIDNIFAKEGIGDNTNPVFAPTYMDTEPIQVQFHISKIPKLWKKFEDEDIIENAPEFSTNFDRRILYYDGVKNLQTGEGWQNVTNRGDSSGFTPAQFLANLRTDYPYMYSVDVDTVNDNSLYFNTTDKSHGLFEKYYRNTIKTINEGRIIKCKMYLTPTDISTLDFRKPVLIEIDNEHVFCTINKIINYNPAKEDVTDVELLTVVSSQQLTSVVNTQDTIVTRTIKKRIRNRQLQTRDFDTGLIVDVWTEDENGNIVPVFE